MTAADKHLYDTDLLDVLSQRVMVGDGAMGTQLQAADLTLDDFRGLEGCNEILNETRPDVLETIHRNYFEAGADAVETNTFGCNLSNLGDYDIADRIRDLSQKGTAIARRVADELGSPDRKRYVLGSMGPGTKLPTLGHTEYAVIRDAYTEAALGMLDGGADAILVETCQDLLQLKAAVLGSRRAMTRAGRHIPVFAHVTVETTGTMLLGSEIGAALTAVEPLGVDMIGLNCATGPAEMSEHLRHLSRHARIPVSVMPNRVAGAAAEGRRISVAARRIGRAWRCPSPSSGSRWSAAAAPPRPISAKWLARLRTSSVPSDRSATSRRCRRCTPQSRSPRTPRFW
ncbi:5-methyltetrahydrofolate--homocystein methyltransferase [Mycobacterium tuberculosis CAS/NITR204]|uniref:5-methyltetrahydrofolate--homocystein methyltransferase n=1 Tax=Mycobacterium tuberculosis CAS/NITR204 TaxID=1310114 RepID=R4MI17_MYCTX|nr:5-methyltetrahydrofolate--homocystein methyltransferase [Mycobacterium tuberculosis CAS/NITR204]